MIHKLSLYLAVALLMGTSMAVHAQVTSPNGVRSGYSGGYSGSSGSSTSNTTSPGSAVSSTQTSRNLGTGQGRTEGAMGLAPQLQREMGISRQQ
jgi:hypothetical protein